MTKKNEQKRQYRKKIAQDNNISYGKDFNIFIWFF